MTPEQRDTLTYISRAKGGLMLPEHKAAIRAALDALDAAEVLLQTRSQVLIDISTAVGWMDAPSHDSLIRRVYQLKAAEARAQAAEDALRLFSDKSHWQCRRCSKADYINCYCGHYTGPIPEWATDNHPYGIAAAVLAASPQPPSPQDGATAQPPSSPAAGS